MHRRDSSQTFDLCLNVECPFTKKNPSTMPSSTSHANSKVIETSYAVNDMIQYYVLQDSRAIRTSFYQTSSILSRAKVKITVLVLIMLECDLPAAVLFFFGGPFPLDLALQHLG